MGACSSTAEPPIRVERKRRVTDDFMFTKDKDLGSSQYGRIRVGRLRATVPAKKVSQIVSPLDHRQRRRRRGGGGSDDAPPPRPPDFALKTIEKKQLRSPEL